MTMAIGSVFAAANTMYAAVSYRSREIATLRVMGFRRGSIVLSFVFEAILLSLLGAAVGIVLMLPFNGMSTSTANNVTFSEVEFSMRITLSVVINAIIFAVVMGLIGGVAPAWNAARKEILASLRD
jgi:ABC-type antimicrobial peptide transport system permease subunit